MQAFSQTVLLQHCMVLQGHDKSCWPACKSTLLRYIRTILLKLQVAAMLMAQHCCLPWDSMGHLLPGQTSSKRSRRPMQRHRTSISSWPLAEHDAVGARAQLKTLWIGHVRALLQEDEKALVQSGAGRCWDGVFVPAPIPAR